MLFNMPYGVSPVSHEIYRLHMAAFYVCCVIGLIVFGVLIYSLIRFRKSRGAEAVHFHEHLGIEILWTTLPFLILVALAVPATLVLMHIHNTDKADLTVKVTGYQWKWKYEYLDQGIHFFSNISTTAQQINNTAPKTPWFLLEVDHPLVVPVDTKIRLLVTADDVVHSWWVPELGVKQDAVPGYINENWFSVNRAGTYRGQCGELCGVNHAFMPIVVEAVSKADFQKWVAAHQSAGVAQAVQQSLAPLPEAQLLERGRAGYEKNCAMCHQPGGTGLLPSFPALRGSRIVTGPVQANVLWVLKGSPGTAMQPFGEQLDVPTIAAILTYIRHAWGNDILNREKGYPVMVQPADVSTAGRTP